MKHGDKPNNRTDRGTMALGLGLFALSGGVFGFIIGLLF